ncbi:hypothetical protein OIU76_013656 [Salix suchowensis]|nr:hypothetical protein OIU76_013656 [Salix suchowensis]
MLAASLRSRSLHLSSSLLNHSWKPVLSGSSHSFSVESNGGRSLLDLNEIEKVLTDVKADDVKVIPAQKHAEWADYMAKQKQKGARRMTLPSVEGQEGGKWIVIDSGKMSSKEEPVQDLDKAYIKIRPKRNNSKRPANRDA